MKTHEAGRFIARAGYDAVYGARPPRRYIQRELETRIGRAVIKEDVLEGTTILVDVKDEALTVTQGYVMVVRHLLRKNRVKESRKRPSNKLRIQTAFQFPYPGGKSRL